MADKLLDEHKQVWIDARLSEWGVSKENAGVVVTIEEV